jgi:hypothetical protein
MMNPLENLIIHPEMQLEGLAKGDLLSQVLAQIRLTGDRVYSCALADAQGLDLDEKSAHICVLQHGKLHLEVTDQPAQTLNPGDVILLPHGPAGLVMTAVDGAASVVICRFWFDASSFQAMLFALPRLIHIQHAEAAAWSEGILHFMLLEAHDTQPGGALMISRLIGGDPHSAHLGAAGCGLRMVGWAVGRAYRPRAEGPSRNAGHAVAYRRAGGNCGDVTLELL